MMHRENSIEIVKVMNNQCKDQQRYLFFTLIFSDSCHILRFHITMNIRQFYFIDITKFVQTSVNNLIPLGYVISKID